MPKRFGTDGIRGAVNEDLTAELALEVGRAIGLACREGVFGTGAVTRPRIVVGRDTRPSGDMLEGALVAGACSSRADVLRAGVIPTPGVAFLTADLGADAGVVLSASHNPAADNGIKVFGPGGWKLGEVVEGALESLIGKPAAGPDVGRVVELLDAEQRYIAHLADGFADRLRGIRVVVDCAYGAAYRVAPRALARAGAQVVPVHATADGERINAGCGATHPDVVAQIARQHGAIGLTHDGDADRVLAADEDGNVVDGDAIIAMLGDRLRVQGRLAGDAIVVTVMANQALRTWCRDRRIDLVETAVGDRYVLEAMRERSLVLGGEQSGHVIRLDLATTGDGVLTALGLLEAVVAAGGRLADVVPFRPLPQVLLNVRVDGGTRFELTEGVRAAVARAERELDGSGRILVRPSGTEPVIRVMVEATTREEASQIAERIASIVRRT